MSSIFSRPSETTAVGAPAATLLSAEQKQKMVKTRLTADVMSFWAEVETLSSRLEGSLEKLRAQFASPTTESKLLTRVYKGTKA